MLQQHHQQQHQRQQHHPPLPLPPPPPPSHHQQHHHHNQSQNQKHQTQPTSKLMDPQQMHVCRLCDKILSSSSSLDRHMLTHSGERPFVCKRCHMTFTTNGNMHRHMRTHLHKDSLARQQQEQQHLKSLGLIGGTSLSTTSPSSNNNSTINSGGAVATATTITCPSNINTLSSAAAAAVAASAAGQGARETSTALAASAAAQLNQQLVAAFKQHLLTVVQSKQANLDYGEEDDDDEDDEDDEVRHHRERDNDQQQHEDDGERGQENEQVEDRMDDNDGSTLGGSNQQANGNIESDRVKAESSSPITSDDEEEDKQAEEQGIDDVDTIANDDDDAEVDDDEDRMDINDGSTIEVNETKDLKNRVNTTSSIISEDDTSYLGSENNSSIQMPLTPFASSLATTIKQEKNINNQYNNNNNEQLNVETEQMTNFNQHNQLKQHLQQQQQQQQQSDLQTSHHLQPNDISLNSNGSHEIIEDISQSYVKTANPNAARKGGKRNRHCYKCKLCTYSSVDRCTLVRHLRIHSGERPYICGICRYAFTTKANCERHVRKRHKKQYNSLGGAGGGGVKGSNGGGRSLIITDHSNHQTIPVKVNPVAAQTISQTLQRIQEKQLQQQSDDLTSTNKNTSKTNNSTNITTTTTNNNTITADDLDFGRTSSNHNQQPISNSHLDSRLDINNNNNNNNHEATSLIGSNKSKRKHRSDEINIINHTTIPYQRRRLVDKHDEIFSTSRLSTGRKQAQHHLDAIQRQQHQNNSNLLFNPQSSSFAPNLTASSGSEIPPTNELFVNLVNQLQQVITNSQNQQQIEQNNSSNNIDTSPNLRLPPLASPAPSSNISSATLLANMLAAGKLIGNAAMVGSNNDGQQSPGQSTRPSLSPRHLSLQFANQLRNLNSQTPFFIGRNPFDPFNPLDLAAQALDLSCKFQSSK